MPKRTDIKSVMVIGSGPIVIGQAAEFDYSGTQACRVLREEGIRVILVNSNPATIMTDPEMADATYIEPISTPILEQIIAKERPDENRVYAIRNGHKMMSLVTGAGCQLSALTSAYVAADKEHILESVCAAVSVMGISGELAYRRMAEVDGNASYIN